MSVLEATTIEQRLDELSAQLEFIAGEIAQQRKVRVQATELVHDLSPVTSAVMSRATFVMGDLDAKGYMEFVTELFGVVDRVVSAFGPEDLTALGENVVLILEAVKQMTQPEIMTMLRRTAVSAQSVEGDIVTAPSTMGLLRELRDPEVRLGLARTLSVLRTIGAEDANNKVKE